LLQHTGTHCNTLEHTATHCIALQHTATHCNTLEHTATHCIALQHTTFGHRPTALYATWYQATASLQHTATHCNTLQHTAAHYCNTLHRTATYCIQTSLNGSLRNVVPGDCVVAFSRRQIHQLKKARVCHDSFLCVPWLICVCAVTHR